MDYTYRICTRCVMDTSDPEIKFDEAGVCNHCKYYFEKVNTLSYKGEESDKQLENIVKQIKTIGKNKKYDCIIGVSGGVDSSYAAYICKKLNLNALAVHFDNGWNSELAIKNIENLISKLGFDFETYVVDWEEFRKLQLAFLKSSVHNIETPSDHGFLAALYYVANKHNIKYIITGSNFATEGILPKSWGYNAKDIKHLKGVYYRFYKEKLKTFPTLGIWKELYYTYVKKIKLVKILNYVPYSKKEAIKILENELGWKYYGGKHYESRFTRFFQSYILVKKFGIDKRRAHLSTLICSGEITREQALEELQKLPYDPQQIKEDIEFVCKKLNISEEEFNNIMQMPPKSYKEYPNDEKLLKFIYSIYYKLKKL